MLDVRFLFGVCISHHDERHLRDQTPISPVMLDRYRGIDLCKHGLDFFPHDGIGSNIIGLVVSL